MDGTGRRHHFVEMMILGLLERGRRPRASPQPTGEQSSYLAADATVTATAATTTDAVSVLLRFSKDRVPSEEGIFSAVNGP